MRLPEETRRLVALLVGVGDGDEEYDVAVEPGDSKGEDADEVDGERPVPGGETFEASRADVDDEDFEDADNPIKLSAEGSHGSESGDGDPPDQVPFDDTLEERDERIEDYGGRHPHEDLRQRLRETGVADRVQRQLQDLFAGSTLQVSPRIRNQRDGLGEVGGRPDMRQVVRRFAGDLRVRDIFERPEPGFDDDLSVGVVLDLSGSMSGEAEGRAKEAAGAFLFGVQKFGGDVVSVSFPRVNKTTLITGPWERFQWSHLDAGHVNGGTPTSTAVEDGSNLLAELDSDNYLLTVLTDGGARNITETREVVEEVRGRGRGWSVVGFGYGNIDEEKLERQFGKEGYRAVELEQLPSELVDVYSEQHPRF